MTRTFVIASDATPDIPAMMAMTVKAIASIGGSGRIDEIDERVIELEQVSEAEQKILMPNDHRPRVSYFLAWSRTYLKRGGLLDNSSRGVWALNSKAMPPPSLADCRQIYEVVQAEERAKVKAKGVKTDGKDADVSALSISATNNAEIADDLAIKGWREQLLDAILAMSPAAFERLSQRVLREAGFVKVEVRGKSGDGGIDGVGVLRMNLVSFQVYFQCKRWKSTVSAGEIRDFRGALQGRADKGLFIATGGFTAQAIEEATRDGAIAIDLIDGDRLCDLLKEFRLGVTARMVEEIEVDPGWFLQI